MNISINISSASAPEGIEDHTESLVREALSRFGPAVDRVQVRIGDISGSRDGVDAYCRMRVHIPGSDPTQVGTLHVFKGAHEPIAAVSLAVDRMARAIGRRFPAPQTVRAERLAA